MEMRAAGSKDGGEAMKTLERKVEFMKEGVDKLKQERDEMSSKLTAAMWKCREAHILQVKYQRNAEQCQKEAERLKKKLDLFKATYKRQHGEESYAALGMDSMAGTLSSALSNPQFMNSLMSSFSIETDGVSPKLAQASPSSMPSSTGGGPMRCPKCDAVLRLQPLSETQSTFDGTHSMPAGALKQLLAAAVNAGSGDEAPTDGEESGQEKSMSPEDMIANITDEDLLFGRPQDQKERGLTGAHKAGAAYRNRVESQAQQAGKKRRWQLLFADAQDRNADQSTRRPPSSAGASPFGESKELAASAIVLTQGSMSLLEHAKQVRDGGAWKEVAGDDFPALPPDSRSDALRGGHAFARSFGIGGAPVSQSIAGSKGGQVALGSAVRPTNPFAEPKALSMTNLGSLSQSMSASNIPRGQQRQRSTSPPPAHLERGVLSPTVEFPVAGDSPKSDVQKSQRPAVPMKKQRDALSPERDESYFHQGPPLQIIGNERPQSSAATLSAMSPDDKGIASPGKPMLAANSRSPPVIQMSPGGPAPTLGDGNLPFDDEDLQPWQTMMSHGNKKVLGMWNHSFRSRGDHEPVPQTIGFGLPNSPEISRSPLLVKQGLRRVPAQLPHLESKRAQTANPLSSSMPDLSGLDRPANKVRTPPLAAPMSPQDDAGITGRRPRNRRVSVDKPAANQPGPSEGEVGTAPFEALHIGRSGPVQGHLSASARSHVVGASHTVPAAMRKHFAMAANALELGSHVQRHAAEEASEEQSLPSPLIVNHCVSPMPFDGDGPRANALGRSLLS
jgi:hypothetical protein